MFKRFSSWFKLSKVLCNRFDHANNTIFNCKKSLSIKYGSEVKENEYLKLGNNKINWVSSVRHLGNFFSDDFSEKSDCRKKKSIYCVSK